MKKLVILCVILITIFAFCACTPSTPFENTDMPESSNESNNLLPGGIDPANYDKVEKLDELYILLNHTEKANNILKQDEMGISYLEEAPSDDIWALDLNGNIINSDPYQFYDYFEGEFFAGFRNGICDVYRINEDRTLELSSSTVPVSEEIFGYTVNSYNWLINTTHFGVTAPDKTVFAEPVYELVKIPFENRILLFEGSCQSWHFTRCNIMNPEKELLSNKFNYVEYSTFANGEYIGIAFCGDSETEPEHIQTYDENGKPMENGYWFVDKDGNILSERFEKIFINEEWNLHADSLEDVVCMVTKDGKEARVLVKTVITEL